MQPSNQYIVQLHALQRHVGLLVTEREILEGRRRQLSDMVTALTRQVSRYIVRVAELELDLSAYRQHPRTGLGPRSGLLQQQFQQLLNEQRARVAAEQQQPADQQQQAAAQQQQQIVYVVLDEENNNNNNVAVPAPVVQAPHTPADQPVYAELRPVRKQREGMPVSFTNCLYCMEADTVWKMSGCVHVTFCHRCIEDGDVGQVYVIGDNTQNPIVAGMLSHRREQEATNYNMLIKLATENGQCRVIGCNCRQCVLRAQLSAEEFAIICVTCGVASTSLIRIQAGPEDWADEADTSSAAESQRTLAAAAAETSAVNQPSTSNTILGTVRLNHTINEVASSSGSSSGPPEKRRRNGKDEKNVKGKNANK